MAGGYGGSAGEAKITQTLAVTPGERLIITIGQGGTSAVTQAGGPGTNSSIQAKSETVVVNGGAGGKASSSASTTGGESPYGGYGAGGEGSSSSSVAANPGGDGYVSITWG